VSHGVGPSDRVGLAEEVVGQADVAVGVGTGQFGEGRARPGSHFGLADAEERREVRIALPALEQELEHRLLVSGKRHMESVRSRDGGPH
jgi:hypothetical protein